MGIVNRRNAVLGWAAWQVGKRAAMQKAKSTVPRGESRRPGKKTIVSAVAAAGGALWFWRRRRGGDESE